MATTRSVRAQQSGPVQLHVKSMSVDVQVVVDPTAKEGEVTVSTTDDTGTSADIVNKARLSADGTRLTAELDEAAGGVTVINQRGGGFSSVSIGGRNSRVVATGGGVVMVGGRIVSGGQNVTVIEGGSPITIVARVPAGSSVSGSSECGNLETRGGPLAQVSFSSQCGDVEVSEAQSVNLNSMSGDVRVDRLTGSGMIKSMSGNCDVYGPDNSSAIASTMSGDVTYGGGIRVDASTMSGRVRNR